VGRKGGVKIRFRTGLEIVTSQVFLSLEIGVELKQERICMSPEKFENNFKNYIECYTLAYIYLHIQHTYTYIV